MSNLKRYEIYEKDKSGYDKHFFAILVVIVASLVALAAFFKTVKPIRRIVNRNNKSIQASFLFKKKVVEKPKPKPKKKVVKKKPIDLTKTKIVKKEVVKEPEKKVVKPVKRVFGIKKVYSSGLGSGGSMDDAVVNKLGNTVNKDYDTTKATKKELKGDLVPLAKISRMPQLDMKFKVKPEYTKQMIDNEVEGIIKAKILIDVDGSVKEVKVLNDLGFGSKKSVREACYKLKFKPALEDGVPVAVRITIKFNLQLRGS